MCGLFAHHWQVHCAADRRPRGLPSAVVQTECYRHLTARETLPAWRPALPPRQHRLGPLDPVLCLRLSSPQPVDHAVDRIGRERRRALVNDAQELWKSCSELLRVQVSEATWLTWFDELKPVTIVANTLVIAAPSSLVRERITGRYAAIVEDVVAEVAQSRLTLDVLVGAPTAGPPPEQIPAQMAPQPLFEAPPTRQNGSGSLTRRSTTGDEGQREQPLNPRYTFDAFVIGASNRFAHAAAQRVAETPGQLVQPALHPRRLRFGQDPPAPRHRPLRARELPQPRMSATCRPRRS